MSQWPNYSGREVEKRGARSASDWGAPYDIISNVDDIVTQLAELRVIAQRRYVGEVAKLPTRETTIAVVDDLVSAIYPRHFAPKGLSLPEIDGYVAATLRSALTALAGQARLELALKDEGRADGGRQARDLVHTFASGLHEVRAMADQDARAALSNDASARSVDEIVFCYPGFYATLRYRLAHKLQLLNLTLLASIVTEASHARTGIQIHPAAEIGERFFINHGTGVVIGETAKIGRNVSIEHAVTITDGGALASGVRPRDATLRGPVIEDDVVIESGATIRGDIVVGAGSRIGGNVWLTKSVPPQSRVPAASEA